MMNLPLTLELDEINKYEICTRGWDLSNYFVEFSLALNYKIKLKLLSGQDVPKLFHLDDEIPFNTEAIKQLLAELKTWFNYEITEKTKSNYAYLFYNKPESLDTVSETAILKVTKRRIELELMTEDKLAYQEAKRILKEYTEANKIYLVTAGQGGLQLANVGSTKYRLTEINYSKQVIEQYHGVLKELNAVEPKGRIAIFSGAPGTGKTHMLKALINDLKHSTAILLPPNLISSLTAPEFATFLINNQRNFESRPPVIIIEDADECLVPRDGGNISAISTLLNVTDGILGSVLDIRLVATTNAEAIELDAALKRPGRMIDHVRVDHLSPEEATKCYKAITGNDASFADSITLAEVYAKAHDAPNQGNVKEKSRPMGFGSH